ncbi:MAG: hypothetical protein KIT33_09145 [Candidatus Kapabacteria bacterium]|nr:hypothetical protein [Ignavibacteriota bacterium]MCW5885121.1 hypothetical protein [Candidatus Kapabacteria bacterium]
MASSVPEIDRNELLRIINLQDYDYRFYIFNELKKSLIFDRFEALLKTTKNDSLTYDEITEEVESVRKS